MLGARNRIGLTDHQIRVCVHTWSVLCGKVPRLLDLSEAASYGSRTRFDERRRVVILGADAYAGSGAGANSRMSVMGCLAHELAHVLRAELDLQRPFDPPDVYLDEAETSIFASFLDHITRTDREDLVEDARDRLIDWLAAQEA